MTRLSLTLDILAWIWLALWGVAVAVKAVNAWQHARDPRVGLIAGAEWWVWAAIPAAAAWIIAGWLR